MVFLNDVDRYSIAARTLASLMRMLVNAIRIVGRRHTTRVVGIAPIKGAAAKRVGDGVGLLGLERGVRDAKVLAQ